MFRENDFGFRWMIIYTNCILRTIRTIANTVKQNFGGAVAADSCIGKAHEDLDHACRDVVHTMKMPKEKGEKR